MVTSQLLVQNDDTIPLIGCPLGLSVYLFFRPYLSGALASENLSWYNRDAASHADFGS